MKLSYEDLISGDAIPIVGVGHIKSPRLRELKPAQGVGYTTYNLYINLLAWEKNELLDFARSVSGKKLKALDNEKITSFDAAILIDGMRNLLQSAMGFFLIEEIVWDDKTRSYLTNDKETKKQVGVINRENFDEVRDLMLQLNYINVSHNSKPPAFSSEKARVLWEAAQRHLKESAKKPSDKRMELGNIISKISCVGVGYTLLNIYDLTVFQLYDQFFQYGYLRAMNISDMAFSNHGGKKFDIQAWLKPIKNYEKEKQK